MEGESLGNDLLRGAREISMYIFNSPSHRRTIYLWAATSNFPVFKMGAMLCARKSTINRWIEAQEGKHFAKK